MSQLKVFYTAKNITAVHGHAGVVQGPPMSVLHTAQALGTASIR